MAKSVSSFSNDQGFTLIELLVGLALLSFLSLVLFESARFGIESWTRAGAAMTELAQMRNAQAVLSQEITRAYPMPVASGTRDSHIDFDGTSNGLTYLVPVPDPAGAMAHITIGMSDEDATLVRHSVLELGVGETAHNTVLLNHVHALRLRYFGPGERDDRARWVDSWHNRTRLPQLVRFEIALGNSRELDFLVTPRLSAAVGCSFDPLTKNCRGS